ncbi:hypothetical protein SLS64_007802 [Diaporthe eres]|uniref:Uncharacterized protein n=1 Tax=Diaporthe eres TaxID=83184 RepID=A0ABR1P650_DIAER
MPEASPTQVPFTAAVPEGGSFAAIIPGWGTGELVSFVSALVNSNSTITYEAAGSVAVQNVTYDQYVLAPESLLDQTNHVSPNGTVRISFPQKEQGQHYRLFAFYQKPSGNKNLHFTTPLNDSIFDAGSYVVDHFDKKGAETIIDFWEEHILVDGIREQVQRVGHYGWSYNYLASENLDSPDAIVENGVLAPMGPAWKALAVASTSNVTLGAIASLQRFAESGLPIIFVGGSPSFYPTGADTNVTVFEEQLAALQSSEGVYSVGEGQLANQLSALGLSPRVAVTTNGTWYTTWRETEDVGYALIYADLVGSSGDVTIADTRTPFFLNPWTGEETPVLIYEQDEASTIIPLDLAGNQTHK